MFIRYLSTSRLLVPNLALIRSISASSTAFQSSAKTTRQHVVKKCLDPLKQIGPISMVIKYINANETKSLILSRNIQHEKTARRIHEGKRQMPHPKTYSLAKKRLSSIHQIMLNRGQAPLTECFHGRELKNRSPLHNIHSPQDAEDCERASPCEYPTSDPGH